MVKIVINGTVIEETPEGWEKLTSTLKLDRDLKALFETVDVPLTFYFDGYRLIKSLFDANGYCYSATVQVLREDENGQYVYVFDGLLFFKDIEFTEGAEGFSAKCQLTDNSFFAKIRNNRNLKAKVYVGKSKSGLDIDPADYWRTTFFKCLDGSYYSHLTGSGYERNDTSFRAYDVLRFLVDFMSDGTVDFVSDYFDTGDGSGYMITCGLIARFTSGAIGAGVTQELFEENFPDLSFSDVFKELDKACNLGIRVGANGSRPYLQIEEYEFLYPATNLQTFANLEKLNRKTAVEYLPSKVKIGSETITDENFLSFPAGIRFQGTKTEEYVIVNDCGTDQEIDLVNSWIIDTNTIEDLVENGATTAPTSYDSTIVLINTTLDVGNVWGDAVKTNWLTVAPPYFYNEVFINANKAKRQLGNIPASIAAYLSVTDDSFTAESSAVNPALPAYYTKSVISEQLVLCDVELTDPNNNYDPVNYRYTAPSSGVFTFYASALVELYEYIGFLRANDIQLIVRRKDSADVFISDTVIAAINVTTAANSNSIHSLGLSGNVNMDATDRAYLYVKIVGPDIKYRIYASAQFQCISTADGGGIYQTYDPDEYPVIRNQFEYPISFTEFRSIKSNPLGLFSFFVKDSKTYFGWIEEIKYKHFQDQSNFILISNEKNN